MTIEQKSNRIAEAETGVIALYVTTAPHPRSAGTRGQALPHESHPTEGRETMNTSWRTFPPTPSKVGDDFEIVERYTHQQPVDGRGEFRHWLETAIYDLAARPPDHPSGRKLSRLYPQIWEFAVECAGLYCTEWRPEPGEVRPVVVPTDACPVDERKAWAELLERLGAVHAFLVRAEELDADRLANYLSNFSSSGHKAMITELWTKG